MALRAVRDSLAVRDELRQPMSSLGFPYYRLLNPSKNIMVILLFKVLTVIDSCDRIVDMNYDKLPKDNRWLAEGDSLYRDYIL